MMPLPMMLSSEDVTTMKMFLGRKGEGPRGWIRHLREKEKKELVRKRKGWKDAENKLDERGGKIERFKRKKEKRHIC